MNTRMVPSRSALRRLDRLCREPLETQIQIQSQTRSSGCRGLHSKSAGPTLSYSSRSISYTHRNTAHVSFTHGQGVRSRMRGGRSFTTSITHNLADPIRPYAADPDPQHSTRSQLPDITNYYTLFPSTLPHGPPGPAPLVQSADASRSSPSSDTFTAADDARRPNETPREKQTDDQEQQPKFTIPLPALRKEFLRLQSTHHPDKYPTTTPSHKQALGLSSLINTAYKTLSDPLLRAQYLLQLQYDIDVTSEDNTAHPTDQTTLMEVMECQEQIESASSHEEIDALKEENQDRIRRVTDRIAHAFESRDVDQAVSGTVRLKYWRSLQQGLDDWEPGKEVRLIH